MRLAMIVVVSVLAALPVAGASLLGREIVVSSDTDRHTVPITLKVDGEAPKGGLVLREEGKRKMLPATLRDGSLTFVVDRLRSGRRTYTVEARDASRGPQVRIEQRGDLPELEVWVDGELFTVYHYADKYKKPFLWPVNAESPDLGPATSKRITYCCVSAIIGTVAVSSRLRHGFPGPRAATPPPPILSSHTTCAKTHTIVAIDRRLP